MNSKPALPHAELTTGQDNSPDNSPAGEEPGLLIDLGCGAFKTEGFIGVDRFALPGVDVVCDLDSTFPFPDDSASYIIASHSLEHVESLPHVMAEIYRISRDRAIVTIVAPYHATGLNRANPYHKQVFNEHTARFFTNIFAVPTIPTIEFDFPHASVWGLIESDNSAQNIDIRPLRQEFFYFPAFQKLPEEARRVLRQHLSNVCDQMLLHAVVVKSPITDDELRELAATTAFVETAALKARRELESKHVDNGNIFAEIFPLRDAVGELRSGYRNLHSRLDGIEQEATALQAQAEGRAANLDSQAAELQQGMAELRSRARFVEAEVVELGSRADSLEVLASKLKEMEAEKTAAAGLQAAISMLEGQIGGLTSRVAAGEGRAENLAFRLGALDARGTAHEARADSLLPKVTDLRKRVRALEAATAKWDSQTNSAQADLRARAEELTAWMAEFSRYASALEDQTTTTAARFDDVRRQASDIEARVELLERDATAFNIRGAASEASVVGFASKLQNMEERAGGFQSRIEADEGILLDLRSRSETSQEQMTGLLSRTQTAEQQLTSLQTRFDAGEAQVNQLRVQISDLLQQLEDLKEEELATRRDGRDVVGFGKAKQIARLMTGRGDLAPLVGPNFRPLLEASLLSNSINRGHRLSLSQVLGPGSSIRYDLPVREGVIQGVEIALSAAKVRPAQQLDLLYDLFDVAKGTVVFSGSKRISMSMIAVPIILPCAPIATTPASRICLRLGGSTDLGRTQARLYEWQRLRWRATGPTLDRRLFGRVLMRSTALVPSRMA